MRQGIANLRYNSNLYISTIRALPAALFCGFEVAGSMLCYRICRSKDVRMQGYLLTLLPAMTNNTAGKHGFKLQYIYLTG